MTLARAGLIRSLLLALVAAVVIFAAIQWLRARDREVALTRVAHSFQTELARQSAHRHRRVEKMHDRMQRLCGAVLHPHHALHAQQALAIRPLHPLHPIGIALP